jgi:hypothetical protein
MGGLRRGMVRNMNCREVARSNPDNPSIATKNQTDFNRSIDSPCRGTEIGGQVSTMTSPRLWPWAASPQKSWPSPFKLYFSDHRKEGNYRSAAEQ